MSAPKLCPTCGVEYPSDERFCPRDGTALRSQDGGADLVGSIIADRYLVLSRLGEGGMGQVYLAEHVKMGRKSAVKVMNPGTVNDAAAISRFNREAANASRINHPNVAGIYDFGETADGLIFLAMEFVEGERLTALVDRHGALPPARAADIVRQTAVALAVAHDLGIVHRDLKPDNIMVAHGRDGSDHVKVVDFGIAKAVNGDAPTVTRTGLIVGTPAYMSPEQLAGDPLDGRSDIYSLGLVAFHLLTGQLPFASQTAQESLVMRLTEAPRTLIDVRPQVTWTAEVQAVMDRALARDATHRYASATDFARALVDSVARMPVPALAHPGAERAGWSAPPPPTRVDSSASRAVGGRRRGPSRASLGVAAAGVLALAAWGFRDSIWRPASPLAVPAGAPPIVAAAGGSASPSGAAPVTPGEPVSSSRSDGVAAGPALSPSTPPSKIVESSTVAPAGGVPVVDVEGRIPALLEAAARDSTASGALREARSLMPRAKGDQVVGLSLVQATALGLRNDSARACPLLRGIRDRAKDTPYESNVNVLLESC